jgi:hypothetical protein
MVVKTEAVGGLPALPQVSISRMFSCRDKLVEKTAKFLGQLLVGDVFHEFVRMLCQALPKGVQQRAVQSSVYSLLGTELSLTDLRVVCYRLAGNTKLLQEGTPAPTWDRQYAPEWVLCEISNVVVQKRRGHMGAMLTFDVLSGSPVSQRVRQFWSAKRMAYSATYVNEKRHGFGFKRIRTNSRGESKIDRPFEDYRQFFGLQCFMLAVPNEYDAQQLALREVGHTACTTLHNKMLIQARLRDLYGGSCKYNYPENQPCHSCPVGRDNCKLACHLKTFVLGKCESCGSPRVMIDPADQDYHQCCVSCATARRRQ